MVCVYVGGRGAAHAEFCRCFYSCSCCMVLHKVAMSDATSLTWRYMSTLHVMHDTDSGNLDVSKLQSCGLPTCRPEISKKPPNQVRL